MRTPFTHKEIIDLTDELCRFRNSQQGIAADFSIFSLNLTDEEKEILKKADQIVMNRVK